jgi:hypothetical protein
MGRVCAEARQHFGRVDDGIILWIRPGEQLTGRAAVAAAFIPRSYAVHRRAAARSTYTFNLIFMHVRHFFFYYFHSVIKQSCRPRRETTTTAFSSSHLAAVGVHRHQRMNDDHRCLDANGNKPSGVPGARLRRRQTQPPARIRLGSCGSGH